MDRATLAVINRRYELLERLGEGSQGAVFAARDRLFPRRELALKVVTARVSEALMRFEFAELAKLEHPHLARVYDLGRVEEAEGAVAPAVGALFFTQERVPGVRADEWCAALPENERCEAAARIGVAVARALAALHRKRLMHRDVKPSNILVSGAPGAPAVKLIDLGLAGRAGAADGLRAGTLGYIAPEAAAGFAEERSDLFSLGAALATIATGRPPHAAVEPLAGTATAERAAFWDVVRRLAARRPADRFDSAREVVLALGRAFGADLLGGDRGGEALDAASEIEDPAAGRSSWRSAELVGRDEELAAFTTAVRDALAPGARRPRFVFVTGPAGVGKTRLTRAALVAWQLDSSARLAAPPLVLVGTAAELVAAVRGEAGADETLETARLFGRLRGPTVCVVDDGDSRLAGELVQSLAAAGEPAPGEGAPLCLVVTMRDAELARLAAETTGAVLLELGPLSEAAEAALIEDALREVPSVRLRQAIRERTSGIPLLTEMALSSLAGLPRAAADAARLSRALALPAEAMGLVVGALASALSPDARSAVEAMAALGEPAPAEVVAEVGDLRDRAAVDEAAYALEQRGLSARGAGDRAGMRRSVADAVLDGLAAERRRELCRRAFDALSRPPAASPAVLARCAARAEIAAEAARWARRAAEVAEAEGALVDAARSTAIELDFAGAGERDDTALRLAALCRQTGAYDRAAALAEPLAHGEGPLPGRARVELAAVRRLLGRPDDALEALDGLDRDAPPDVALEARVIRARIALDKGEVAAASRALEGIAGDADPRMIRSGALAAKGLVAWHGGDAVTARRLWTQGRDAARVMGATAHEARFCGLLGMAAHVERGFAEAAGCYGAALALADRAGDAHGAATYAVNLAAIATETGDVAEALVRYRDGMARLLRTGRRAEVITARANYAQLLLRLGDVAGADRASRRVEEDAAAAGLPPMSVGVALCVRGDVLLALGDPRAARERLLAAERLLEAAGGPALDACRRHLVEAAVAEGDSSSAGALLLGLGPPSAGPAAEERLARLHLGLAVAVLRAQGVGPALDALVDALEGAGPLPLDAGAMRVLVTAATAARELGRQELARDFAARGDDLAARLRSVTPSLHRPEAYRWHAELRALGSPGRDLPDAGDPSGWERLVKINTRLNSETRIGPLLDLIMDNALEVTRGERGFLLLRDPSGAIRIRSARNIDRERLAKDEQDYSRGVAERVLREGEPIVTTDAHSDARLQEYRSVIALHLRVIVAVPLQVAGRVDGVIYVDSRAGAQLDEGRLAVLTAFADQAAIALTNARLRADNLRRRSRIEKLNRMLASRLEKREDELARVKRDLERRTKDLEGRSAYSGIVGTAPKMREMFRVLDRIAGSDVPVVISGESGTGKELVAKAIHFAGARKLMPFVAENCAAIPPTLLESILFGHVRGAFTGATKDAPGLFVEADRGTLFLDEIGELPQELQVKLLRALQEGEVRPVGGSRTIRVDVRIVAATNQDLAQLVQEKRFRDDLYYRLHVMEVRMPPLRERREDVPILVEHFLSKHAGERQVRVDAAALEALAAYAWPGNVRQLENEILRALVLCDDRLGVEHLSDAVSQASRSGAPELADLDMERQLGLLQRRLVRAALHRSGGNRTKAAELLGVSRFGLQKMLARMGE
ncbi:MAG: sigma 54-interacting transcriptional regulator [Proteobacteria bacterium]|jgi:transcriptional regulator with GAF, ATPase, and Fis domain/tetratricopeptide (TPR) repeat protein|nr:sigma 54-interacting transcriptional regulator [Pseudomonadota bacterium]